jgi:hypothetical protein
MSQDKPLSQQLIALLEYGTSNSLRACWLVEHQGDLIEALTLLEKNKAREARRARFAKYGVHLGELSGLRGVFIAFDGEAFRDEPGDYNGGDRPLIVELSAETAFNDWVKYRQDYGNPATWEIVDVRTGEVIQSGGKDDNLSV